MIELKSFSAGYEHTEILHEITLNQDLGTLTCIVGPNGCGKSTLLKSLIGLTQPMAGELLLDGLPLPIKKPVEVAKRISYLSQGRSTPDMTVSQLVLHGRFPHLAYPRRYTQKDREIADRAIDKMQLAPYARLPLSKLSGGIRQRAYLAMALSQCTDYILLDEPTTYLDVSHQLELIELLRRLTRQSKGVIAVLHDLPLALRFADRIAVMEGGRLVACGTPEEIYRSDILLRVFGVSLARDPETGEYYYRYPTVTN